MIAITFPLNSREIFFVSWRGEVKLSAKMTRCAAAAAQALQLLRARDAEIFRLARVEIRANEVKVSAVATSPRITRRVN